MTETIALSVLSGINTALLIYVIYCLWHLPAPDSTDAEKEELLETMKQVEQAYQNQLVNLVAAVERKGLRVHTDENGDWELTPINEPLNTDPQQSPFPEHFEGEHDE